MTYGDTSKDRRIRIYRDIVFDNRVARHVQHVAVLVVLETLGTQCYTLIECDVITDDTGFANDDACTMVDSEIFATG